MKPTSRLLPVIVALFSYCPVQFVGSLETGKTSRDVEVLVGYSIDSWEGILRAEGFRNWDGEDAFLR